jgi:hypothetical protein
MRSYVRSLWMCSLVVMTSTAVAQQNTYSIEFNGETIDLVERGAVDADAVWKFEEGKPKIIFVCWENPANSFAKEMEIVRDAVKASWQAHSKLQFLGWGKCVDRSPGIRILIKDDAGEGPRVRDFGRKISDLKNGMILNFAFSNWIPGCQEGPKDTWIARIAVHEFGHAIGFRHEQDRDDTVGDQCRKLKTGPNPDLILTKYDPKSIMNYCWCEPNSNLSELDKVALQKLYDRP